MSVVDLLVALTTGELLRKLVPTWWDVVGYIGQMLFFSRFLFQWLASERRGHSYIPVYFWWLSISGAVITVVYLLWKKDPPIPILLGQAVGLMAYSRNLLLIRKHRRIMEAARVEPGDALYAHPDAAEPQDGAPRPDGEA
ncbi:MAG: lipid-A-disaccharide synthase N-terminal domain-containing protein [Verrucomicrobia bacterium]|nr:lipid-A-disaccharide synthase N-terminal domain-containing protein [Verrucomicrobiota bacterium]